jgi:hypothetical protein
MTLLRAPVASLALAATTFARQGQLMDGPSAARLDRSVKKLNIAAA